MAANTEKNRSKGPGESVMGLRGIILVVGYLMIMMAFVIWSLVSLWPPIRSKAVHDRLEQQAASPSPTPTPSPTPIPTPLATQSPARGVVSPTVTPVPSPTLGTTATGTASPTPNGASQPECEAVASVKEGFCLNDRGVPREGVGALRYFGKCLCIYDEDRLLLIVLLAGALGALVHGLRSLSWYIGNRRAVWSWSAMYFMLPFLGAGLAAIFYLVIRGGFFSPTSTVNETSPFGFAALAALVGMFTEPAVIKLRKVAITVFEPPEQGKDHVGPAPKITEISPKQGLIGGGESVTITGENFSTGIKVTFDGVDATVISASETSITVTTPPHAKGKVSMTVTNEDKQIFTAKEAFEYTEPASGAAGGAGDPESTASGEEVDELDGHDAEIKPDTPDEELPITEGGVK